MKDNPFGWKFTDSEDKFEFICDSCGTGMNNIRPQKITNYDEEGNILKEEWVNVCTFCGSILE